MSSTNPLQTKHVPKDAQVIMSILKDMGVVDFEPQTIVQLLEFTYRYVTSTLEDARVYANHANKKVIDVEDVQLAVHMQLDKNFTTPPPRDMLLEVARNKNSVPLPQIRPHCGIRLPPDRYCMTACNYELKSNKKILLPRELEKNVDSLSQREQMRKPNGFVICSHGQCFALMANASMPVTTTKSTTGIFTTNQTGIFKPQIKPTIKRSIQTIARTQAVTIPKPIIKFTPSGTITTGDASSQQQQQQQQQQQSGQKIQTLTQQQNAVQQVVQTQQQQQQMQPQQQTWKITTQQPVVQTVMEIDEPPASLIKRRMSNEDEQ